MALFSQSSISFETCSSSDDLDPDSPQMTLREQGAIVFITGASESKRFLFEAARRVGLDIIIIDSEESAGRQLVSQGVADQFMPVVLDSDVSIAANQCYSLIRSLEVPVRGVVTFMEMSVYLASKVAELCGFPGLSSASVAIARDKRWTRQVTSEAGLPSPAVYSITSVADIDRAAEHVGFPAVLKPIVGADSLGVKRVDTTEELRVAFDEALKIMCSVVISAGFLSCPSNAAPITPSGLPMEFLLEEYLDGPEVDIDLLMYRGQCYYSAVSDNGQTVEPYFTETYGVLPSLLPVEDQAMLIRLAVDSAQAIGLASGVFHVEAKLTSRGPRLIEINARLGGGPVCEMHKRVSKIDLAYEQVRLAAGLPPSFKAPLSHTFQGSFAYMTTNATASGRVGPKMDFLESFRVMPLVDKISCRVVPGDMIVGPEQGQPTWLTEIWMEAACPKKSQELVDEICKVSDKIAEQFALNYDPICLL